MSRPRPTDHLPGAGPLKEVGLARISTHPNYNREGSTAVCSCGWNYYHARDKVREDAIDRHIERKHKGRGVRL